MGCPNIAILGQNLTFSKKASTTPTGNVTYGIYEDVNSSPILSGNMTKDFASIAGLCVQQIACTAGNGFETYKSYLVLITYTVAGVTMYDDFNFICLPTFIADITTIKDILEGDAEIDTTQTPWQLVVKNKDTQAELIRKDLKDVDGDSITATSKVIGQHKEP